jgi:hypothetical protein
LHCRPPKDLCELFLYFGQRVVFHGRAKRVNFFKERIPLLMLAYKECLGLLKLCRRIGPIEPVRVLG